MNGNKLLEIISDIDPRLIEDADKSPRSNSRLLIGVTSVAGTAVAAALVALSIGHRPTGKPPVIESSSSENSTSSSVVDSSSSSKPDTKPIDPPELDFSKYKDLPKISDVNYTQSAMGCGKEVYLNYSELKKSGPWNGEILETMPVFISHSTDMNVNVEKMYSLARDVAAVLGIPANSLEISDNFYDLTESIEYQSKLAKEAGATDEEIEEMISRMIRSVRSMSNVQAKANGITITVDTAFCTNICFEQPIKLPEGITLNPNSSDEEKLLGYITENYKEFIMFSKPVCENDRISIDDFCIYESDCDLAGQIVNYCLNSVVFSGTYGKDDEIRQIYICSDDNCEKLADYPILTPQQAEAILKSTRYDDKNRMPADAEILKIDLYYHYSAGSTGVMPYYQFYVKTDKEVRFGKEVTCDVYTIAAVPEEFIDVETKNYAVSA